MEDIGGALPPNIFTFIKVASVNPDIVSQASGASNMQTSNSSRYSMFETQNSESDRNRAADTTSTSSKVLNQRGIQTTSSTNLIIRNNLMRNTGIDSSKINLHNRSSNMIKTGTPKFNLQMLNQSHASRKLAAPNNHQSHTSMAFNN